MSFSELFHDLGQFVMDPEIRWQYCVRVKRGLVDTSEPGMEGVLGTWLTLVPIS